MTTYRYRPDFPGQFGSIEDARASCAAFFDWDNYEHYHSGVALLTPYGVHSGLVEAILQQRKQVLLSAFECHPERFKGKQPNVLQLPEAG